MKQILFVIMLAMVTGNITLAGEADFTGEWIVNGDIGEDGIIITIDDMPPERMVNEIRGNGPIIPLSSIESKSSAFTVISVGTFFEFTANGSKLTGSMIRQNTEEPIFDGKISGNKITFTVKETIGGKNYSYSYTGKLSDDSIQFDVKPPSNGGKSFKFKAKLVSP